MQIKCLIIKKKLKDQKPLLFFILLGGEDFSSLHKLEFDEFFAFTDGDPCRMFLIDDKGRGSFLTLGRDYLKGELPHVTVPAGWIQGIRSCGEWSLVSASMMPGFDYEDFSMPSRDELLKNYPQLEKEIKAYTRE